MRRRSFVGLLAGAVFTVLTAKVPVLAEEPLNSYASAPKGLGYLIDSGPGNRVLVGVESAYTPLTDDQIAEMVAWSVAHTSYATNWGRGWFAQDQAPIGRVRHSFTFLTDEEIAERDRMEAGDVRS